MAVQREYLSPNEIAEYLGVSPFTIRRYIKLGELKAVKLLGGFRVHRDELQRFLKAHEVNPAEEDLEPEEVAGEHSSPEHSAPQPAPQSTSESPRAESGKRNGLEKSTRANRTPGSKNPRRATSKK